MASIQIDFSIHSNPYYLKVVDLSVWGLIKDKPSIINILLPGYESPVVKYYDKNKLNVFNSSMLGVNTEGLEGLTTLSDGIYKITVTGSPETYTKEHYYLKTDLHDMEVDKIFVDRVEEIDKEAFNKKMTRIEFLKRSAEAFLRYDNIEKAGMLFEEAQDMVEDILQCSTCD